ncbi:MAG: hypothetical protein MK212_21260, partial [Saprospiraceae bacterium]|nr:hypothetical protein [Saprospiraceae bacterium]
FSELFRIAQEDGQIRLISLPGVNRFSIFIPPSSPKILQSIFSHFFIIRLVNLLNGANHRFPIFIRNI